MRKPNDLLSTELLDVVEEIVEAYEKPDHYLAIARKVEYILLKHDLIEEEE